MHPGCQNTLLLLGNCCPVLKSPANVESWFSWWSSQHGTRACCFHLIRPGSTSLLHQAVSFCRWSCALALPSSPGTWRGGSALPTQIVKAGNFHSAQIYFISGNSVLYPRCLPGNPYSTEWEVGRGVRVITIPFTYFRWPAIGTLLVTKIGQF